MSRLFTTEELHELARQASALAVPRRERFETLIDMIDARWPGRIEKRQRWVLNSANGALGTMTILYASLSEYLIIFGSPIGTEGHSGRYFATVHDFMVEGEMWVYVEGEIDRTVFRPGDHATLKARSAKGYRIEGDSWMLEYAHGCIPAMLPAGVWDNLFSNLDFRSLWWTFWDYGRITVRELLRGKI
ncbi:MAG TPA: ERG2 family protein [bacterium]|nr:ERG2 family protein [bacterium]